MKTNFDRLREQAKREGMLYRSTQELPEETKLYVRNVKK